MRQRSIQSAAALLLLLLLLLLTTACVASARLPFSEVRHLGFALRLHAGGEEIISTSHLGCRAQYVAHLAWECDMHGGGDIHEGLCCSRHTNLQGQQAATC